MFRVLLLGVALAAIPALAQDDEDLPSLPTAKPKPKPQVRPKPKPKPKPAPVVEEDLPALPAQKGDLIVKLASAIKGAKLYVDDKEIGLLPQPPQSLTAGEHTVTVRRLGYAAFNKKVTIAASKANEVNVMLDAVSAVLSVSSDVAGATVLVNGRVAGSAPLFDLEVPPGNIEIAVKKDGYHDGAQVLSAKAGRDYPVEVKLGAPIQAAVAATDAPLNTDLTPSSSGSGITTTTRTVDAPVYKRWWFWAGAVAVVAAVAAGSVVIATQAGPTREMRHDDWPCHMSGNMCDGWINEPTAIVPIKH